MPIESAIESARDRDECVDAGDEDRYFVNCDPAAADVSDGWCRRFLRFAESSDIIDYVSRTRCVCLRLVVNCCGWRLLDVRCSFEN